MIVCGACGHTNAQGTEFCANCGRFLEWTQESPPEQPISRPPQAPKPQEPGPASLRDPVVTVDPPTAPVAPGEALVLTARVRNMSGIVDGFALTIAGISAAWWKVTPTRIKLYPSTEGEIRLEFRPPRGPQLLAGVIPAALSARSDGTDARMTSTEFSVEVMPVTDPSAEIVPRTSRAIRTGHHRIRVSNERGNAPWRAVARAADPDALLTFGVEPEALEVPPGGTGNVAVAVQAPSMNWYGRPDATSFTVELRPTDGAPPIRLDGQFEQRSLVRGLPLALAAGLLAVVLFAVGVLAGWIPPRPPDASASVEAKLTDAPATPTPPTESQTTAPSASAGVTPGPTDEPTPAVAGWAIDAANAIGGFGNPVGVTVPTDDGAGQFQAFDNGVFYLTPDGVAVPLVGDILGTWRCRLVDDPGHGCPQGPIGPLVALGFPTAPEQRANNEPFQLFEHGGIYCDNGCGFVVTDPIHALWRGLLPEGIDIGLPTHDVIATDQLGGGWLGRFKSGFILSNADGGDWLSCSYEGDLIRTSLPLSDCVGFAVFVKSLP
jgi:hypothetical protein